MRYPEKFLLKLPEGTLGRVDAVSGNRSEFIRDAVLSALGDGVVMSGPPAEKLISEGLREHARLVTDIGNSAVGKISGGEKVDHKKNSKAAALTKGSDQKSDDERVLLDFLRCGVRTEREIAREIGWTAMRVSKVVARLGSAGKVKFRGGAIEVYDV